MFEKEIKFIADFNLNKVKSLGSFITFDKILNSGVHPAVIQYISAELDFLINEDRKKLLQQSVFDYSGPEVAKYFNLVAQEVKKTKKISYEDIKKLVVQAVSFNINYLMRPNWALAKIVFNEETSKSTEEINLVLNYVYYYDYIKNIFKSLLQKRKIVILSLTEFESILNKIDKELFETQAHKLIENALVSIAEFSNLGSGYKTRISPNSIESYLKEKNQLDYLFKLRRNFPVDAKQRVDISEISKALFTIIAADGQTTLFEGETIELEETPSSEETENELEENPQEEIQLDMATEPEIEIKLEPEKEVNEISQNEQSNEEPNIEELNKEEETDEELINEELHDEISPTDEEINEIIDLTDDNEIESPVVEDEEKFEIDEELLNMYEKELESNTENLEVKAEDEKINNELNESKNEDLDSLYDFEEETKDILKEFNDSMDNLDLTEEKTEEEVSESNLSQEINLDDEVTNEKSFDEILNEESLEQDEEEIKLDIDKLTDDNKSAKVAKKRNKDFFEFISDREIEKVVGSVFNEDREDFANTMERLSECENYDEATEILKSVFLTYRVNPYSRDAIILTNSVSNYFSQD